MVFKWANDAQSRQFPLDNLKTKFKIVPVYEANNTITNPNDSNTNKSIYNTTKNDNEQKYNNMCLHIADDYIRRIEMGDLPFIRNTNDTHVTNDNYSINTDTNNGIHTDIQRFLSN